MNFFQSFTKMVTDTGAAIGSAASQASQAVVETAVGTGEAVGSAASQAGQAVVETATEVGGAIGSAAAQASQAVVETAVGTGEAVGSAASQAGQAVVETATGVSGAISSAAAQASQTVVKTAVGAGEAIGSVASQAGQVIVETAPGVSSAIGGGAVQAIQVAGQAMAIAGNNPQLQQAIKSLNQSWLTSLIEQVDVVKAETVVRKLQQENPDEQPRQIAHRLMLEKAVYAGVTGLASSLVPGAAAMTFAVDWSATAALSAELVYQVAAAYGLNLKDPERKSEVLTIFGLALGGGTAIKAGLGLLRSVPVAGAMIGVSSNAVMIYALGYNACRFYEAKQNPLIIEATIASTQSESEKYLETGITQEVVMDQILVHVVLAGHPGKTWEEILPELQTLNLSPGSLEAIAAQIESPSSLETLLDQLSRDFAIPLLAQCHKVAQLDGATTPEEAKIIDTISQKFGISLDSLKESHHQLVMA